MLSVDDILEDFQTLFPKPPQLNPSLPPDLAGDLLRVYERVIIRKSLKYEDLCDL